MRKSYLFSDLFSDLIIQIPFRVSRAAEGALDGPSAITSAVRMILELLRALMEKATDERAKALYSLLVEYSALEYVDQLLAAMVEDDRIGPECLLAVGCWLATGAADREPVKCAVALLGLF